MINAFKLTKNLLNFVLIPLMFVISIGLVNLTDKVFLSSVIALVFLIIGILALEFLAMKKYNKIGSLLTVNCDPEAYRDSLIEVLSKNTKNMEVQLDLSYAYYHCGDYQQMKNILDGIDLRKLKSKKKNISHENLKFSYYNMWLFYSLHFDDIESAEKILDTIDELYLSSGEVLRSMNEKTVKARHLMVDSRKGEIPDIEEKLVQNSVSDKIFYQVANKNFLGRYYFRNGMNDKAKECLEFVVQNGNKLYMVKEAQSMLADLKKEN